MNEVELYLAELYREKRRLAQIPPGQPYIEQSYAVTVAEEMVAEEISDRGGDN